MSQSLGRGLSILIELGDRPHNLDELAAKLGVHKTTVLRLLRTMEAERFVRRDEHHRFHLGPRLSALAERAEPAEHPERSEHPERADSAAPNDDDGV
jgi:DNA-binding IclR family transcriptional regulator